MTPDAPHDNEPTPPEPADQAPDLDQGHDQADLPPLPGDGWISDYNPFEPELDPGAEERFKRMMEE